MCNKTGLHRGWRRRSVLSFTAAVMGINRKPIKDSKACLENSQSFQVEVAKNH